MQAQTLQHRSFASVFIGLVAASILVLGGAGGYAVRALTAVAGPTRIIYVQPNPAPAGFAETRRALQRAR